MEELLRPHQLSYWPGPSELNYGWCWRCGLFQVSSGSQTAFFITGRPLPLSHLTFRDGLSKDPGCGIKQIWVVEMREHRETIDDPYEYDSTIEHSSGSREGALGWAKREGSSLQEHSKDEWWWMAVYAQGLDGPTAMDEDALFYLDWNGIPVEHQPLQGYRDESDLDSTGDRKSKIPPPRVGKTNRRKISSKPKKS